jgi:hypothetical protein
MCHNVLVCTVTVYCSEHISQKVVAAQNFKQYFYFLLLL